MRAPRVSVVIPTHNRAHLLPATLESVLGQTESDLEGIVVDDGSTDGTAAAVSAIRAGDPRLVYLPLPRSGNLARVRNAGVARARGELIAFLDSDDLLEPEALAAYRAVLAAHPEAGWTLAGYRSFDAGGFRRTNLHPLPGEEPEEGSVSVASLFFPILRAWTTLYTSTITVRRTALDRVGPFEERLTTGEYDLFTRLAFDSRAAVLHRPLVRIRKHPGNSSPGYGVEGFEDALHGLERFYAQGAVPRRLYDEMFLLYRYRLGRFLLSRGERQAARRQFLACLRRKPTLGGAWSGLATSLRTGPSPGP
ncbi:MAG TPA: glycosyltransferase family A protein [Thermoanaerobaculia bacterium]|nr:glycosyltransferase family A protein [Thermoanaerobaculia bacterium]